VDFLHAWLLESLEGVIPNFTATRTYIYVAGNIIDPAQNNTNENTIYNKFNASINATTGHTHSGATGDGPKLNSTGLDLTAAYAWTGVHSFQTSKLKLGDSDATNFYIFAGSNLAADRTVTLPLLAGNDTFVMEAFAQTLTNKTYSSGTLSGTFAGTPTFSGACTFSDSSFKWGTLGSSTMFTIGGTQRFAVSSATSNILNVGPTDFKINNQADAATALSISNSTLVANFTKDFVWGSDGSKYMYTASGTQRFAYSAAGGNVLYSGGTDIKVNNQADTITLLSIADAGTVRIFNDLQVDGTVYVDGATAQVGIGNLGNQLIGFAGGVLSLNLLTTGLQINGTICTSLGTSPEWSLGGYTPVAPGATGYVTVVVAGVTYKLLAST
jgi:hypothetical protein